MRNVLSLFIVSFLVMHVSAQNRHIHINQFGYYPEAPKVAVVSDPMQGFNATLNFTPSSILEIRNASSDDVVFSGSVEQWNDGVTDVLSGDRGWHFDFTTFKETGEYYITDPANDERSPNFKINSNPYIDVLKASFKMFYYNRCGIEKVVPYADERWTDAMSFTNDRFARYIYEGENVALEKDLSGGWFDAGDYNKYITFNYSVIHNLLAAYELNPQIFTDDWNIPESGNGLPDLLDEVKWELDWMKKMVNNDGSVIIKMGSRNHDENSSSPPSANDDLRYYGPTCTAASATLASNFSHAALVFTKQYNSEDYANELVEIAAAAFDYVLPYLESNTLETGCDDGSIVAGDADLPPGLQVEAMVSAAIYLYEFTGLAKYHDFIIMQVPGLEPITSNWWGPYKISLQEALLRYSDLPTADETIANLILNAARNAENNTNFYRMNNATLYRDFIPDWSYHWGSNNSKAGYGNMNLLMAFYGINDQQDSQEEKAEELLHSFHGVNPLGLVYLTNMYELGASKSINEMFHAWFYDGTVYDHALDSEVGPAPGYLVGGPNKDFSIGTISPPSNQPPTKSYLDYNTGWPDNSWEISEPAIYYQANYFRLLSQIVAKRGTGPSEVEKLELGSGHFSLSPNPAKEEFMINSHILDGAVGLRISDISGKLVFVDPSYELGSAIRLSGWMQGNYVVQITSSKRLETLKLTVVKLD